jgi:phospholipid-transporting ATPase
LGLTFRESNNSDCIRIKNNKAEAAKWRVMLASEKEDGMGFMETSTLDGEKNLKPRSCLKETLASVMNKIEWIGDEMKGVIDIDLEIKLSLQQPNPSLYNFEGFISFV